MSDYYLAADAARGIDRVRCSSKVEGVTLWSWFDLVLGSPDVGSLLSPPYAHFSTAVSWLSISRQRVPSNSHTCVLRNRPDVFLPL